MKNSSEHKDNANANQNKQTSKCLHGNCVCESVLYLLCQPQFAVRVQKSFEEKFLERLKDRQTFPPCSLARLYCVKMWRQCAIVGKRKQELVLTMASNE
jgi:hypothetical protein